MASPAKSSGGSTRPGKPVAPQSGATRAPASSKTGQASVGRTARHLRLPSRRSAGGCLLAFICVVVAYLAIGSAAVYQGLQERTAMTQQEAEVHYQRGLEHVQKGDYELAIAEFEHALRLDATHRQAREALRDAKTVAMAQPTATSATLNQALSSILAEAESFVQQQMWPEAVERLSQLRDLDPDFETARVGEMLYETSYKLGMQLVQRGQLEEAGQAFERALQERPGDAEASRQLDMVSLYKTAKTAWAVNWPEVVSSLEKLHGLAPDYLDVNDLLYQAHEGYGDDLAAQVSWCEAETQYSQAAMLRPGAAIQDKQADAKQRCETPSPAIAPTTPVASTTATASTGTTLTGTPAASAPVSASGSILYSRFNTGDGVWEVVAVAPSGGSPRLVIGYATQPAVSLDGKMLAYHSELGDSIGIHVYNLATGQDTRATKFGEDATPDWAPDGTQFVFPSRRSGDRRWVVYVGWADARGDPVALVDGRTPAWSPDGSRIAFQGTDPQGNNPGLYLIGPGGGPSTRLTDHESDRAPAWSPDGGRIAFMSSRDGRWQLYTVDAVGGRPQPLAQSGGNDGLPAWSPDGSQIAFVSDRDGAWGVYVVPAAPQGSTAVGGQPTKVADWGENRVDWMVERISWGR
jgi:tetratricopeptide (TPR) repeat protein